MKQKAVLSRYILFITAITFFVWLIPLFINAQNKEKWIAPKSSEQLVNPIKDDKEFTKAGKKSFQQLCVICHGNFGKGDGLAGAALNPKPTDLTLPEIQKQSDGALYWKITEGRSPMAGYKDALTETNRWQLVNYIRTLK